MNSPKLDTEETVLTWAQFTWLPYENEFRLSLEISIQLRNFDEEGKKAKANDNH